jgi:hypothetical protein
VVLRGIFVFLFIFLSSAIFIFTIKTYAALEIGGGNPYYWQSLVESANDIGLLLR